MSDRREVFNVEPHHIEIKHHNFEFTLSIFGVRGNTRVAMHFKFSLWWVKHFRRLLKQVIAQARGNVDEADTEPTI